MFQRQFAVETRNEARTKNVCMQHMCVCCCCCCSCWVNWELDISVLHNRSLRSKMSLNFVGQPIVALSRKLKSPTYIDRSQSYFLRTIFYFYRKRNYTADRSHTHTHWFLSQIALINIPCVLKNFHFESLVFRPFFMFFSVVAFAVVALVVVVDKRCCHVSSASIFGLNFIFQRW